MLDFWETTGQLKKHDLLYSIHPSVEMKYDVNNRGKNTNEFSHR
jgi:hypothetical protein